MVIVCILSISVISATSEITSNKQVTSTYNNVENNIETNIRYDDVSISNMNDELSLKENNGRYEESGYRTDKTTTVNEYPLIFRDLNTIINDNSTIYLSNNYTYNIDSDFRFKKGISISRNLTIYGNGVTLDWSSTARIFNVSSDFNVNFYNINFINGNSTYGGAIYKGNAYNCTFTHNIAEYGGAIYKGNAYNCTFTNNIAKYGGAIYKGNAYNCTFTRNNAYSGGAISGLWDGYNVYAYNCTFTNNIAKYGGAINFGMAYNCTFTNNAAFNGGAIYKGNATNCTFTNNNSTRVYEGGGAIYHGNATNCNFINNKATSSNGYGGAIAHGNAYNCTFKNNKAENYGGAIYQGNAYNCTFIENYALGAGRALWGDATSCTFIDNYCSPSSVVSGECTNCTFKYYSKITASPVTITYNIDKYLIITLKDLKNRSIPNAEITVNLDRSKKYTTDDNGQVKINVANLVPKTYNVKLTYAKSANKNPTTSIKKKKKKGKPKITAKSAIFKLKVKTKKYTATFKNNKNQAFKNTKVTLKVGGKTYSVKTNSKGQATFKITNLKKIGSYIAVITFPTNKYYNKVAKKVKITVKRWNIIYIKSLQ